MDTAQYRACFCPEARATRCRVVMAWTALSFEESNDVDYRRGSKVDGHDTSGSPLWVNLNAVRAGSLPVNASVDCFTPQSRRYLPRRRLLTRTSLSSRGKIFGLLPKLLLRRDPCV